MKKNKSEIYYFTYGSDKEESGHPFTGGWTIVEAPDFTAALMMFRAVHPDLIEGKLNCCSVYHAESWGQTIMAQQGHSFGHACHERITWEVYDNE